MRLHPSASTLQPRVRARRSAYAMSSRSSRLRSRRCAPAAERRHERHRCTGRGRGPVRPRPHSQGPPARRRLDRARGGRCVRCRLRVRRAGRSRGRVTALPPCLARRHLHGHKRATLLERPHGRTRGGLARGAAGRAPAGRVPGSAGRPDAAIGDGAVPIGAETRETLRIERGLPRFGVDFDGSQSAGRGGRRGARHLVHEGLLHRTGADRSPRAPRSRQPRAAPSAAGDLARAARDDPTKTSARSAASRAARGCRKAVLRRWATCGAPSPMARSWSPWTPGAGAWPLGTLVEWPRGARSSGDRAQPCGG